MSEPTTHVELRPGAYADSVTLLQVSRTVASTEGVLAAQVAMATPLNLEVLTSMGFSVPDEATPNDLVVALRLDDPGALDAGLAAVDAALREVRTPAGETRDVAPPRTTATALRGVSDGLVLVSVPGASAMVEAMDALDAGCDVMVFSDNVPVEQEVALKQVAAERGLLVMGPDCGTAVVDGLGLGFANTVQPGPVGLVAASGTGCQQLLALLDHAGVGVTSALGVGGRDLSTDVGGAATLVALDRLDADPAVELVVVVSKPPADTVAEVVRAHAATLTTPVELALLGPGQPDLTAAAESVLARLGRPVPTWPTTLPSAPREHAGGRWLRGLFVGGTLCDEAMLVAAAGLGEVRSNIPLSPELALDPHGDLLDAHTMVDFGDDGLTAGRAHPMIDPSLRLEHLARAAADDRTAVILLDVVLGHGAEPDPAAALAPVLARVRQPVVVAVVGTGADPQDLDRQVSQLAEAGAEVHLSNAAATRRAVELLGGPVMSPHVVNVGAGLFADAVSAQAVEVTRVDWQPPVAGTEADLATVAADPLRRDANDRALAAFLGSTATLVDVAPAAEVLGLQRGEFLHAGPPITWEHASGPLRGGLMAGAALEGLVEDPEDAVALFEAGTSVSLEPCHHRSTVGPMAGVVTPGMWMFVLEDPATGRRTHCSLNEGLGKVLRYGAYGPEVLSRLRWMGSVLGPLLQRAVRDTVETAGPVDVTGILTQMLQMGDEAHNRNRAGTLMLMRDLAPAMVTSGADAADVAAALRFVGGNDHFFLNLAMPACKLALDAARDIDGSTMVVAMARNGTEFGIQTAGTGDEWFTGPAQVADGLYLGDHGPEDANPDIGDSAITETAGLGGFAMATAPAIVRLVGGSVPDALATTRRMHEITLGENPRWSVPVLEFQGVPTGIDVTRVCRTGILPQINTGMAGRVAGVGQVGAGLVTPPAEIFPRALARLAELTRARRTG